MGRANYRVVGGRKNVTKTDILSIEDMCAQKVRSTNNGQGLKCIDGEIPKLNLAFTVTRKLSPKNKSTDTCRNNIKSVLLSCMLNFFIFES